MPPYLARSKNQAGREPAVSRCGPSKYRTFDVEALAVIDHVFPAGLGNSCPCVRQLLQLGKWRFIGEIMFAGSHNLNPERSPIGRDGSGGNQPDIGIVENLCQ